MVELFGHCWMCAKKELSPEEFKKQEDKAFEKKYGKENTK